MLSLARSRLLTPVEPGVAAAMRRGLGSADGAARAESVDALAMLGDATGLLRALSSPDPYLRERAAGAVAPVRGARITWCLLRRIGDPAAPVRAAVALALAGRGGWLVRRALQRLARDREVSVRYAALRILAGGQHRAARAALERAQATDAELWLRETAAAWLRRRCREQAGPRG